MDFGPTTLAGAQVDGLIAAVRSARVGGSYWGAHPALPSGGYLLAQVDDAEERARRLEGVPPGVPIVSLDRGSKAGRSSAERVIVVSGVCDPWHLLSGASAVIVDADDELALIAAIAGVSVECVGSGRFAALSGAPSPTTLGQVFREHVLGAFQHFDPFSGEPLSFRSAIECCRFWRDLIDSNRDIRAAVGFAFWKRSTVAPLLWRGTDGTPFRSGASAVRPGDQVAIWRSRTPAAVLSRLESLGARLVEVEDGFIRSAGLGADCVPPLSIVVDGLGAHFEADRTTELEQLLQNGVFSNDILDRARELRKLIVTSGLSKYGAGRSSLERRAPGRKLIFVPGQVEDDRAVLSGGAGLTSNLELLRRVRAEAPDAYIMYKPHPDIEAGHRTGAIADETCLSIADEIVRDEPVTALLDLVNEVHVNTSLAGFEALLRNKPVTTHGVPFYAGWGLTRDLGPVPARRTAERTLDELVAAVLLLYPRYLDPVTGLPCPAEVLVRRLTEGQSRNDDGMVVRLRKIQGRLRRGLAALRSSR
jgi:capsular polysaccharide export protein